MLLHQKPSKALVAIAVACAILGATLLVPGTTAITLNLKIDNTAGGGTNDFNLLTTFPMTVGFSVTSGPAGSSYFWQFGDGTNSTEATPTHIYGSQCVYDVRVQVTASNGSVTSGGVNIGAFTTKGTPGGALALCPPQGTAGVTQVELAGGFFAANQVVNVTMGGATVATVTADRGAGDWLLNLSTLFTSMPEPNGSQYTFTTSPPSLTSSFTTLEGVSATPASGAPGDNVTVRGGSYPADSSVQVFVGGVSLGTAQTDGTGSFLATFQVPDASPLNLAGSYSYTTVPAILGSQASFASTGSPVVSSTSSSQTIPPPPPLSLPWWFLILIIVIILIVVLVIVVFYLLWGRMKRRSYPPPEGEAF